MPSTRPICPQRSTVPAAYLTLWNCSRSASSTGVITALNRYSSTACPIPYGTPKTEAVLGWMPDKTAQPAVYSTVMVPCLERLEKASRSAHGHFFGDWNDGAIGFLGLIRVLASWLLGSDSGIYDQVASCFTSLIF